MGLLSLLLLAGGVYVFSRYKNKKKTDLKLNNKPNTVDQKSQRKTNDEKKL